MGIFPFEAATPQICLYAIDLFLIRLYLIRYSKWIFMSFSGHFWIMGLSGQRKKYLLLMTIHVSASPRLPNECVYFWIMELSVKRCKDEWTKHCSNWGKCREAGTLKRGEGCSSIRFWELDIGLSSETNTCSLYSFFFAFFFQSQSSHLNRSLLLALMTDSHLSKHQKPHPFKRKADYSTFSA